MFGYRKPFIQLKDSEILFGFRSDHSLIVTELEVRKESRNIWNFNASLFKDKTYAEEVNEVIRKTKEQYAALVYERKDIGSISSDELQFSTSDQLFFRYFNNGNRKENNAA